jgi:hypothetical protein
VKLTDVLRDRLLGQFVIPLTLGPWVLSFDDGCDLSVCQQHSWKESDQPSWLTPEFFAGKIQPLLASVPMSTIRIGAWSLKMVCEQAGITGSPHRRIRERHSNQDRIGRLN